MEAADATLSKARTARAELPSLRERLVALKAAQFNVGLLSEQDRLAKIEADIADLVAARTGNEAAVKQAEARLPVARQARDDAAARIAPLEQAVAETRISVFGPDRLVDQQLADMQWERNTRAVTLPDELIDFDFD